MRAGIAISIGVLWLCQGCEGEVSGPSLPRFSQPYVVSDAVRRQLKNNADRKFAWDTSVNTCRAGMEAQRSIGMFEKYEVTDTDISSYCDCMADEAYRGRTTAEIANMHVNPESGQCRRYYRDVLASEIEL